MTLRPLTERDLEVLRDIATTGEGFAKFYDREPRASGYVKTLDIGGTDCSYHSRVATKLAKRGLVEVYEPSKKFPWRSRYAGNKFYRITDAGRGALKK